MFFVYEFNPHYAQNNTRKIGIYKNDKKALVERDNCLDEFIKTELDQECPFKITSSNDNKIKTISTTNSSSNQNYNQNYNDIVRIFGICLFQRKN